MNAIISIARTTVGEAIRRRVLLVILCIGVLFLVATPLLSALGARQGQTVLTGFTLGIIKLTSAVIAIVLTVYMLPNEIERRTIYTILSKPVQRWQFLLGKYFGAVAALALMMALMTVTMMVMFGISRQGNVSIDLFAGLARIPLMYFVQMSLLAAVAVCLSTFVSPIVNFFLSGGMYLLGSFLDPLFSSFSDKKDLSPVLKGAVWVIHTIVPNFANFDVQNPIVNPGAQLQNEFQYYVGLCAYAFFYISILMLGAILIFDRREV